MALQAIALEDTIKEGQENSRLENTANDKVTYILLASTATGTDCDFVQGRRLENGENQHNQDLSR